MGTRNLIAVKLDGELKIAQYGQWDGYPSGQGADVLAFARSLRLNDARILFEEKLRASRWSTEADWLAAQEAAGIAGKEWITLDEGKKLEEVAPQYSRDTEAKILDLVLDGTVTVLDDRRRFAGDPVFCEWAYLLDLDADVLEVYAGTRGEAGPLTREDGWITVLKRFPLADLPELPAFVAELDAAYEEAD